MKEFLKEFPYKAKDIIKRLEGLNLKVLVIGDAIIDQYHYSSSIGKSPKDNIIVVKHLSKESFAGGALAAANHIAGWCDVTLVTCLGKYETYERFIRNHLKRNVTPVFFYRGDTSTPVKGRYVEPVFLTKMFGVSFVDDHDLPEDVNNEVCDYLMAEASNYDLVLVTDFGHGFINSDIIFSLIDSKFLAVNTQTNTDNAGFNLITKYTWADYVCLDEPETRLACQDKYGRIDGLIKSLALDLDAQMAAVTHGQYNTLMYSNGKFCEIPIFSKEVRDTTGAGDAFLSVSSLCVASGFPMDLVGFVGNAVGALKVKIVCNRSSVEPEDLYKFIEELL